MKKEIKFSRNFRFYLILCLIFLLFKSYSFGQLNANKLNKFNVEFHDHDSIVRIGDALYNVFSEKVIGFNFNEDSISVNLEEDLSSRWLAIDPYFSKYVSFSPYNFVNNSPLVFKDPDGKQISSASDYSFKVVENAIFSVFKSEDIALDLFNFNTNPKRGKGENPNFNMIKTNAWMKFESKKDFSKKLKELAKERSTDDKKIKFSKKEIEEAYKLYQKIDSKETFEVIVTNSKQVVNQGEYEKSTEENNETKRKVNSELSKGVLANFDKIEKKHKYENEDGTTCFDETAIEQEKQEYLNDQTSDTKVLNSQGDILVDDKGDSEKGAELLKQELVK